MPSLKQITEFIESQPIAMAGVSRNPKKFGYAAFKELKEKGMNILPVNPLAETILGVKSYPSLKDLPSDVKGVIVMTGKMTAASVVREALDAGIKQIWIQQMSDSPEANELLKSSGINYITGECILMHYKPGSIHKFHRAINRFFGRFPK
jgi:predicted CoA-binding protein